MQSNDAKKEGPGHIRDLLFILCYLFLVFSLLKACAAIDGLVLAGLEGNSCNSSAIITNRLIHRAGLLRLTACLAALRLVYKALFSVELLLAGSKNEFLVAIFADESLVFVHVV